MKSRFKTLYRKPKTLTDRYDESSVEVITRVLRKPEAELGWNDFNLLFRAGVAAASYEEGVYILPEAFAFLCRNPKEDGVNCIADAIWFISEYAEQLGRDDLLEECREQIRALLAETTREFVVCHWDKATNPEMCGKRAHYNYVQNSQLVETALEALLRFRALKTWAEEFLDTLLNARGEPVKSAWFLELIQQASKWIFFKPAAKESATRVFLDQQIQAMPGLAGVWEELQQRNPSLEYPIQLAPEPAQIEYHADVVRTSGALFAEHPTYWADRFRKVGLGDESQTTP